MTRAVEKFNAITNMLE